MKIFKLAKKIENSLNGMTNQQARNKVNNVICCNKGIYGDQSWEAVHSLWNKMESEGFDPILESTEYKKDEQGNPSSKEWRFTITFLNNRERETVLFGIITAHGAGSVNDPLDKYDITAYVS
jgi:hypothetical protein